MRNHGSKFVSYLLVIVFLTCTIAQAVRVHQSYGSKYLYEIYQYRSKSALDRSALFSEGMGFAAYMEFIRKIVPEDAKVILPPREPVQALANIGYMQYFLMPRELHNCGIDEVEACVLRMTGENSFILSAWKFPPHDIALMVKRFIPFVDGEGGIYVPK